MWKRLKKLKQLWNLTKENPKEAKELEAELFPGKAIFLSDFSEEERDTYIKEHEEGWGEVFNKFRNVLK